MVTVSRLPYRHVLMTAILGASSSRDRTQTGQNFNVVPTLRNPKPQTLSGVQYEVSVEVKEQD